MSDIPVPPAVAVAAPRKSRFLALVLAAQLPILLLVGYLSTREIWLTSLWGGVGISMLVLAAALGDAKGRIGGILISERNLMSLSRFQIVAWTLLICSAFITVALARVFANMDNALAIQLPIELWQLMGISGASSVGAALVIQQKTKKTAAPGEMERAGVTLKTEATDVAAQAQGIAFANPDPKDAGFTDMFSGDEVANRAYIDMSKLQMFFFTLVALVAYGAQLGAFMMKDVTAAAVTTFPPLSQGLIALLGISHATYLGTKTVDRTKTT